MAKYVVNIDFQKLKFSIANLYLLIDDLLIDLFITI